MRCDRCRTAYHWACVDELGRGGCMTMACQGALIPENLPPPPTPSLNDEMIARARERFAQRAREAEEPDDSQAGESEELPGEDAPTPSPPSRAAPLQIAVRARRGPVGTPLVGGPAEEKDYDEELEAWTPRRSSKSDPPPPAPSPARRSRLGISLGLLALGVYVLAQGGVAAGLLLGFLSLMTYPYAVGE